MMATSTCGGTDGVIRKLSQMESDGVSHARVAVQQELALIGTAIFLCVPLEKLLPKSHTK